MRFRRAGFKPPFATPWLCDQSLGVLVALPVEWTEWQISLRDAAVQAVRCDVAQVVSLEIVQPLHSVGEEGQ